MTLGQKLKERRLALNWTLRELAKKVDTDFTYLSKIENDKTDHPPSEDLLKRLADNLQADFDELIALSGQIPEKIRKAITNDQAAFTFLRSAVDSNLSPEDWGKLQAYLKKQKGEGKK